jgi:transcriptional regulator
LYIPSYYKETDFPTLLSFMQHHPFALIVSSGKDGMKATHIPFVVEEKAGKVLLTSHMARPNEQWKDMEAGAELLIVFQGPHTYISPSHYESKINVPTWNYIAVHARGKARVMHSETEALQVLEKTIATFEPAFFTQWAGLTPQYKTGMIAGIVSFEIEVTSLEGKFKLSQNKTEKERNNIVHSFEKGSDPLAQEIAKEMKNKL